MVHFENFSYWQKIPFTFPLFETNEYITDFKEKSEQLNSFFVSQFFLINNNSQLPPNLSYKSNERLPSVKIANGDILKRIANRDLNKTHGHDKISIRMIKICSTSIYKPLRLIFNNCIDNGIYPWESKKLMLCQFTKRWQTNLKKLSSSVFTSNLQYKFWKTLIWQSVWFLSW